MKICFNNCKISCFSNKYSFKHVFTNWNSSEHIKQTNVFQIKIKQIFRVHSYTMHKNKTFFALFWYIGSRTYISNKKCVKDIFDSSVSLSYILSLSPDLPHPGFLHPHKPAHIFYNQNTRASAHAHTRARAVFIAQVLKTRHYLYGMLINWYWNEWFFPFYCQTPVLSFLEYLEPENFPWTISTHTQGSQWPVQIPVAGRRV